MEKNKERLYFDELMSGFIYAVDFLPEKEVDYNLESHYGNMRPGEMFKGRDDAFMDIFVSSMLAHKSRENERQQKKMKRFCNSLRALAPPPGQRGLPGLNYLHWSNGNITDTTIKE